MNRSETQSSKFFERAWTIILGGGTLYIVSHRYPESREGCERVTLYSWGGGPFRTTICSYPKLSLPASVSRDPIRPFADHLVDPLSKSLTLTPSP